MAMISCRSIFRSVKARNRTNQQYRSIQFEKPELLSGFSISVNHPAASPFPFSDARISPRRQIILGALLLLFTAMMIPGLHGQVYDLGWWKMWSIHDWRYGLKDAYYQSNTDYLPLYHYVLWGFGCFVGSEQAIGHYIGYIRVFTLLADYWAIWIVYRWIDCRQEYIFLLMCSMLNIGFSYNTIIWGQVDGIFTAFTLAAFYYQFKGRHVLSAAMLVLALNAKLQAVVFVPLWGILLIAGLHRGGQWRRLLYIVPAMLGMEALILLPFAFGHLGLGVLPKIISGSVDAYPILSVNASNWWFWFVPDANNFSDTARTPFGPTYKQIGLWSFFIASFIILFPPLRHMLLTLSGKVKDAFPREKIWVSAALISLAFFFFNTQMHERYVHPAMIFITAYAFYRRSHGVYVIFSLAYFLNLERVLQWLDYPSYGILFFMPEFIAALFAVTITWLIIQLYRPANATGSGEISPGEDIARLQTNA